MSHVVHSRSPDQENRKGLMLQFHQVSSRNPHRMVVCEWMGILVLDIQNTGFAHDRASLALFAIQTFMAVEDHWHLVPLPVKYLDILPELLNHFQVLPTNV